MKEYINYLLIGVGLASATVWINHEDYFTLIIINLISYSIFGTIVFLFCESFEFKKYLQMMGIFLLQVLVVSHWAIFHCLVNKYLIVGT